MGITAAVTAVVGTGVAIKGGRDAKKASQQAADKQRDASIQSADLLAKAGRAGEADIQRQNAIARHTSEIAAIESAEQLQPFADTGAFQRATEEYLQNLPVSGAIAESIKRSSIDFVRGRPEFSGLIGGTPVGREIDRQGDLSVSAATPQFRDSLMQSAQSGLAGASDVAQIEQRGFNRLGDIAGSEATQRSNILIGQGAQLANLQTGADDARLLSSVAGQNFRTGATEEIAGLAGNLTQRFANDRNAQATLDKEFRQRQGQNKNLSDSMGSF
jgi:hypothetical protein